MAGLTYRRPRSQPPVARLYGYQKVDSVEAQAIGHRLNITTTATSRLGSAASLRGEFRGAVPFVQDLEDFDDIVCPRWTGPNEDVQDVVWQTHDINSQEMKLILRRLVKANRCRSARCQEVTQQYDDNIPPRSIPRRPAISAKMTDKLPYSKEMENELRVVRLQTPTVSRTMKKWDGTCFYCNSVHPVDLPEEWCKAHERVMRTEEMLAVVKRIQEPTHSFCAAECEKSEVPDLLEEERELRKEWPLVSGLTRTRTVAEITERLARRVRKQLSRRSSLASTAISVHSPPDSAVPRSETSSSLGYAAWQRRVTGGTLTSGPSSQSASRAASARSGRSEATLRSEGSHRSNPSHRSEAASHRSSIKCS